MSKCLNTRVLWEQVAVQKIVHYVGKIQHAALIKIPEKPPSRKM